MAFKVNLWIVKIWPLYQKKKVFYKDGNGGGFNVCKCHLCKFPQGILYVVITIKFPMNVFFNKQQIIDI
jgi:hypothetical protein